MKPVNDDFLTDEELQEKQDALFDEIIGKNLLEMEARQAREDIENDPDFMTEEEVQSAWEKIGPRMNATWQETLKKSEAEEKKEARREKRAKKPRKIRVFQQVAAALLIGVVAIFAVFSGNEFKARGIKLKDFHFVLTVAEDHTEIGLNNNNKIPDGWEDAYSLTKIPEDYELSSYKVIPDGGKWIYFNDRNNGSLIFFQADRKYYQDSDEQGSSITYVGEYEAHVFIKDGMTHLVWHNNETIFKLTGPFKKEDMVKIAESVKLLKEQ